MKPPPIFCTCKTAWNLGDSLGRPACPLAAMGIRHEAGRQLDVAEQTRWEVLGGLTLPERLYVVEKELVAAVLKRCKRRYDAADAIGMTREALHNKIVKYNMPLLRKRRTVPS